jgi:hypothetical protein
MKMLHIIKAKLARGGQMNGGEIKLVVRDMVELIEHMQETINELEAKLNALPRGGNRGAKKSSSDSDVRRDDDE